jgi:2-methylisocitrate lyase-like PEP mutase family enzyme
MTKGRKLREALASKPYLVTPGITTALHAKIVEGAGFDYVYVGGYDVSLTLLGLPDLGFITATEMLENARHIARAVGLPVVADVDTGYGNAINVIRTVQDFEAAGVAAIHIEDQVAPKRCGHVAGKVVVPLEEATGKLKAALDARRDKDFVIIARTDAVSTAGGGIDEAIRRGKAYARVGCDVVWAEFPTADLELPQKFAREMRRVSRRAALSQLFVEPQVERIEGTIRGLRGDGLSDDACLARRHAHDDAGYVGLRAGSQDARRAGRDRFPEAARGAPDGRVPRVRRLPAHEGAGRKIPAGGRGEEEVRRRCRAMI